MPDSRKGSYGSYAGEILEVVIRPKKYYKVGIPTGDEDAQRDKITLHHNEKWRIWKNVFVISIAMMTQYVAYQGVLNLQSSINAKDGLGTIALSFVYSSMALSCLVLPTLTIRYLTAKWTLVICMTCFLPFIGFQLNSSFYTLIPSGILLGIAAAPLWAAQATYLTQIGQIYSIVTNSEMDAVITLFFGIFFFAFQNSDSFGNLISSLGNYRKQEKYEKMAKDLAAARATAAEIEYAKHMANMAAKRIEETAEKSDGEDDELERDVTVT